MNRLRFHVPLGAILLLALAATPALAGKAVSSAAMTLREGPGESFAELAHISAGSLVDLRECNTRQWCHVYYGALEGWVHVRGVEQANRRGSGGQGIPGSSVPGSSSNTALADDSTTGNDGGPKGSRSRPSGNKNDDGDSGISAIDGASLPGGDSGGTPGDRSSWSGSNSSSSSGSSGQENTSTAVATSPSPCGGRC